MASQPQVPVSFDAAFERLRSSVSQDHARAFASTEMKDVWDAARDLERQLERRQSLRGLRRIEPFLTGIEQYAKVVEVLCNGTPYLPWIWVCSASRIGEQADHQRHRLSSFCKYVHNF